MSGGNQPPGHLFHEPMKGWRLANSSSYGFRVREEGCWIDRAQSTLQLKGRPPCPYVRDVLIEDDGEQKSKWVLTDKRIRFGVRCERRERLALLVGVARCVAQERVGDHSLVDHAG